MEENVNGSFLEKDSWHKVRARIKNKSYRNRNIYFFFTQQFAVYFFLIFSESVLTRIDINYMIITS